MLSSKYRFPLLYKKPPGKKTLGGTYRYVFFGIVWRNDFFETGDYTRQPPATPTLLVGRQVVVWSRRCRLYLCEVIDTPIVLVGVHNAHSATVEPHGEPDDGEGEQSVHDDIHNE